MCYHIWFESTLVKRKWTSVLTPLGWKPRVWGFQKYPYRNWENSSSRDTHDQKSLHTYVVQKLKNAIFAEKCQLRLFRAGLGPYIISMNFSKIWFYTDLTPLELKSGNFLLNKPLLQRTAPAVPYVVSKYLNQLKHGRNAIKMKSYYNYNTLWAILIL